MVKTAHLMQMCTSITSSLQTCGIQRILLPSVISIQMLMSHDVNACYVAAGSSLNLPSAFTPFILCPNSVCAQSPGQSQAVAHYPDFTLFKISSSSSYAGVSSDTRAA